jgi:DHA2 family multidrug resistance protein-like MFS transporter
VSETAYEVGSVFGTAVLGSILLASYKDHLVLPAGLSSEQAASATETLGGAVNTAGELPAAGAAALLESAFRAFDSGVILTSGIAALLMVLAAGLAWWSLRPAAGRGAGPAA